jgi:hypothetical protein
VDHRAQIELPGDVGQRPGVDHRGPQLGQLALGQVGIGHEQVLGDDKTEHGVAEELQALVGRQAAALVGVRAVRQGTVQQLGIDTHPELGQQVAGRQAGAQRLGPA